MAKKAPAKGVGSAVLRGMAAGAIVIAAGLMVWWWFASQQIDEPEDKTVPTKKVQPAPKPVAPKPQEPPKEEQVVTWRGKKYPLYNEKGGRAYVTGYGVRYHTPQVITNSASAQRAIPWEAKPFKHSTDRMIAILLNTEPGTRFIGGFKYDKTFNKRFLESLKTPIEAEDGDSEDVKLIKEAVAETRADLKARLEKGEDIAQLILDTQNELQQLGAYKHDLEKQLSELARKQDMTEKDMDLYVEAANKMLESRGCSHLSMPELIRNSLRMREARMKAHAENN